MKTAVSVLGQGGTTEGHLRDELDESSLEPRNSLRSEDK